MMTLPMEFVIDVLKKVFSMNNDKATYNVAVHNKDKGICGIYQEILLQQKFLR